MKAIILAAGMGTRLGAYTKDKPKGLLEFAGKSLIERQIDTLRAAGIKDIVIVRGYQPDHINFPDVIYRRNPDFETTNMVETLMCARDLFLEGALVCYSDILYEPRVLETVLGTDCDVGVTVDTDFEEYWNERGGHHDHESLIINNGRITQLGAPDPALEQRDGRYVGLLKFSAQGAEDFVRVYESEKVQQDDIDAPWRHSRSFRRGYMTDMIQSLIDHGVIVTPMMIERGWLEFDTTDDYEKYQEWMKNGTMERFCAIQ